MCLGFEDSRQTESEILDEARLGFRRRRRASLKRPWWQHVARVLARGGVHATKAADEWEEPTEERSLP
jgi:hypothetical protein